MKNFACMMLFVASSAGAAAGDSKGNGGSGIVCRDAAGRISAVELLDYYEVRLSGRALSLKPELGSYENMLNELFDRWSPHAPLRMAQYRRWLKSFESEAGFHSGVSIPAIPDTGSIVIPAGCEPMPIAFQRPDGEIMPGVKRYTISKDLWDLMPEVQKVGLVLHELIYREGIQAGHTTSFPTRYLNGYLSSETPNSFEYAAVVSQMPLLWTEYGANLVLQVGVLKGGFGCPSCLAFRRMATVSSDGRFFEGKVSAIFGDVVTPDFELRLVPIGSLPEPIDLGFRDRGFVANTNPDHSSYYYNIIKEIRIGDWLRLAFAEPNRVNIDMDFGRASTGYPIRGSAYQTDPIKSWLKLDDGEVIRNITSVDNSVIYATDSKWQWNGKVNKYVRVPR
ncbi:MAG: hypothetical protein NDJ89_02480 [Oligoflexia bacterium]|nr:hypothetical protein [Oligoflexia bacterium]